MTKVFINATAAKEGGAKSIIDSYCFNNAKTGDDYYLFCPHKPEYLPDNFYWIEKSTNGLGSFLFSLFFSYFYAKWLGCSKLISFTNINSIFSFKINRVNYFHQMLIFQGVGVKFSLLRLVIKHFNRGCAFIVQTPLVRERFINTFGNSYDISVKWPGVPSLPNIKHRGKWKEKLGSYLVLPIYDVSDENKNFEIVKSNIDLLQQKGIKVVVTARKPYDYSGFGFSDEVILFLGKKTREDFISLVADSKGVLVTSLEESVGLPIFESILSEKKVICLNRPYIKNLVASFHLETNVALFEDFRTIDFGFFSSPFEPMSTTEKSFLTLGNWEF